MATTNAPEVLRSSKALHKRFETANRNAGRVAGKHVQESIRARIPHGAFGRVGNFPGYAATGQLWQDVKVSEPKQSRTALGRFASGWKTDVYMDPQGRSRKYQRIHELGGTIRPRTKPYLVFRVPPFVGQWVRVKQVRIRRKRYFATGWKEGVRTLPAIVASYYRRELRVR